VASKPDDDSRIRFCGTHGKTQFHDNSTLTVCFALRSTSDALELFKKLLQTRADTQAASSGSAPAAIGAAAAGGAGGAVSAGDLMGSGAGQAQTCTLPAHPIHSGCTAVAVLVYNNVLYCANAGDSRAILCRGGQVVELSHDHKPNSAIERGRVEKAGGFIREMGGHFRINGTDLFCFSSFLLILNLAGNLNLSRSIGDLKYKQDTGIARHEQIITAEPGAFVFAI
jgi:hypothetical protein